MISRRRPILRGFRGEGGTRTLEREAFLPVLPGRRHMSALDVGVEHLKEMRRRTPGRSESKKASKTPALLSDRSVSIRCSDARSDRAARASERARR